LSVVQNITETVGSVTPNIRSDDPEPDVLRCRNCGRDTDPDADTCDNCDSHTLRPIRL